MNKSTLHTYTYKGYCNTHPGNYRKNNEDAVCFAKGADGILPNDNLHDIDSFENAGFLLVAVADGVGGSEAGEDASRIGLDALYRFLNESLSSTSPETVEQTLNSACEEIHNQIVADYRANPEKDGMATTLTALVLYPFGAWMIQVGDSRLYCYRNGKLSQISEDQSHVGKLVREGRITEEESMLHPMRNYIDQALGGNDAAPVPAIVPLDVKGGDIFMLCSDGLSDSLYPEQVEKVFKKNRAENLETLGVDLIERALDAAGRDNITVGLLGVSQSGGLSGLARSALSFIREPFDKS